MNNIQAWVMQLCIVCILVTVILSFIKNEKVNNSIKTVLALYILLTAMTFPLGEVDLSDNAIDFERESLAPVNAQALVKENAQKKIMEQINSELENASLSAVCIGVLLNEDLTQADTITISSEESERQAAESLIAKVIGSNSETIIEFKG